MRETGLRKITELKGSPVSRKALFSKRGRRVATLCAAGLGACAVLAACSPVQVGSAAIVGDQRITVASLDTQVSNLQTASKPFGGHAVPTAQMPASVLSWLIRFNIMDQVAADNGISVTSAQSQQALSQLSAVATQQGASSTSELLIANGVPPQLFPQVGQFEAQENAYARKLNGGKELSTQAEANAFNTAFSKASCTAAKSLDIQVSPQFGRVDYLNQFQVVPAADTLSKPVPAAAASPAPTTGLTPAC
jgi:SurA-like N-terminal domain